MRGGVRIGALVCMLAASAACSTAGDGEGDEAEQANVDRAETGAGAGAAVDDAATDTRGGSAPATREADVNDPELQSTASGLKYKDLAAGEGMEAKAGNSVRVHYTGWLVDGTKFDSSVDRGEPFEFALGQKEVIRGWDEGVAGMKVGGRRRLVIPPDLAYGANGSGAVIPPNATLIFEVELLEVRPG